MPHAARIRCYSPRINNCHVSAWFLVDPSSWRRRVKEGDGYVPSLIGSDPVDSLTLNKANIRPGWIASCVHRNCDPRDSAAEYRLENVFVVWLER